MPEKRMETQREHHSRLDVRPFRQNLPATLAIAGTLILIAGLTSCESPEGKPTLHPPSKPDPIFAKYDRAVIRKVESRWYALLDGRGFRSGEKKGRVILEFRLNANGSVSDMKVVKNELDDSYAAACQSAVNDVAPFPPWPEDARKRFGWDHRLVTFTFYYN